MSDCSKCFDKCLECKRREEAYQQGRADAIGECIRMVEEGVYRDYGMLAEQMRELKEQKDGR